MAITESELAAGLRQLLAPDRVLDGPSARRAYDCDAYTVDRMKPTAVALPETTDEVAAIVRFCNRHALPFTARGAGTGLSGGALPALGGVVVSTKKLTRILDIDLENRRLRAQAGAVNRRLTEVVSGHGLHFAPDPSSQSVSTLGGNIAENAGGPHTLKYGVTTQHIVAVTLVDPHGEVLHLRRMPGGPDFLSLVIGGEGTLGIVTEAEIVLTPTPKAVRTALAAFPSVRAATETVAAIIARGIIPAALEMMDRPILDAVRLAFGFEFPSETAAMLLVECDSDSSDEPVLREMQGVREACQERGCIEFREAVDEAERAKLWTARKKAVGAMGRLAPTIVTHDGVIPRSKLPEMLDYCYEVAAAQGLGIANMFHAGDGNLHPCFYFDDRDPKQVEAVVEAGELIIRRCVELGGSVTGEHGVGVEKIDLMPLMFSPEDLAFQERIKAIFNTGELCNPCKILPNQKSCVEHKMRWRGVAT